MPLQASIKLAAMASQMTSLIACVSHIVLLTVYRVEALSPYTLVTNISWCILKQVLFTA